MEKIATLTKAAWANFHAAQAVVASLTAKLDLARADGAKNLAVYKETVQMIDVQNEKEQVDIGYIINDQKACEARNEAAKEMNKRRMRDAEKTAYFWCDPEAKDRCKWRYEDIVIANLESCEDVFEGTNHNNLSMEAQKKAQQYKEAIEENDLLVAELSMLLENAQVSTKKAFVALSEFVPKDQSMSSTKSG